MASRSLTNGKDVQSIAERLQGRSPTLAPSSARGGGHVSQALYVKTSNRHLYSRQDFTLYSDFNIGSLFQHQELLMHENLPSSHSCHYTPKGATCIAFSLLLYEGICMQMHVLARAYTHTHVRASTQHF